jgi:hypothetical protein
MPKSPSSLAFVITFNLGIISDYSGSRIPSTMAEPQAEPQNVDLDAEADDYENDSALGGESIASSTTSINSSIRKYREENGRTYHAYKVSYNLMIEAELL